MKTYFNFVGCGGVLVGLLDAAWSANITMPMSYADEPNATVTVTEESTLTYSGYWAESETSNPVSVHLVPAAGQTLRVTCTQMHGFDTCNAELKVYNGAASISYSLPAGDMGAVAEARCLSRRLPTAR